MQYAKLHLVTILHLTYTVVAVREGNQQKCQLLSGVFVGQGSLEPGISKKAMNNARKKAPRWLTPKVSETVTSTPAPVIVRQYTTNVEALPQVGTNSTFSGSPKPNVTQSLNDTQVLHPAEWEPGLNVTPELTVMQSSKFSAPPMPHAAAPSNDSKLLNVTEIGALLAVAALQSKDALELESEAQVQLDLEWGGKNWNIGVGICAFCLVSILGCLVYLKHQNAKLEAKKKEGGRGEIGFYE